MGKLIDRIERVQKSSGPRLGFAAPSASKQPSMILVAALPGADAALASTVTRVGADAFYVREVTDHGGQSMMSSLKVSSQVAVGASVDPGMIQRPVADFLVVDGTSSALFLGESEELDVVLSVGLDLSDSQLRIVEALPVDAIIVPAPEGLLTLEKLLPYYRVTRSTSKPVLSFVKNSDADVLRVLRDAGVAGFVLEVPDQRAADTVSALRKAIDGLPAKKVKRHRGHDAATVGMPMTMGLNRDRTPPPADPDEDDDEP